LLSVLRAEGSAFADACLAAGGSAAVEACPGWTVDDLLWHMVEVHHFWTWIVRDARDTWEGYERPPRPDRTELPHHFTTGFAEMCDVLGRVSGDQTNWTWATRRDAAFVLRRMVHELAVHRWDADRAAGRTRSVAADVASDGIDEFLTHFLGDPPAGSVHLHCTDVDGEWMVRSDALGSKQVTREHAKGDVALRGAASDLLLVLWRRRELSTVEVFGASDLASGFLAATDLD